MPIPEPSREGVVTFGEWHTWYRITEAEGTASGRTPLVILHGGPGAAHDYTLRMAGLARPGRPVVQYDQLGCGRSTHLPDKGAGFWTVRLFLDELDNLVNDLGIADGYCVLGQSWGGMLAAEHAVTRPPGLRGLVICDSPASMELWSAEADLLRQALPTDVQDVLTKHESAGTTDDPAYADAMKVFYDRYVCRVVPNPPEVTATFAAIEADPTVYHTMNGPSEFHVTGTLKNWSIVDRLDLVSVPTLIISGRHDEATPATVRPYAAHIPGARWEIFESSSHMPHVEEEQKFLQVVGDFLDSSS